MVAITRSALKRRLESSPKKPKTTVSKVGKKKATGKPKKAVKQTVTKPKQSQPLHHYNDVVGRSEIIEATMHDRFGNPTGREYDLGRDGAYKGYNVLIAQFYSDSQFNDAAMQKPMDALHVKGFNVKLAKTENECIKELSSNSYSIVWIISHMSIQDPELIPTLTKFHSNSGGVFLFADNTPYVSHAEAFLKEKFGITLQGDYYGGKTLSYKVDSHRETGHFGQHEIFTGISNLFEGITICHPVYSTPESRNTFVTLATASDHNPTVAVYNPPPISMEGRLCLDCGFTKLYINWDSAGTARYIVNACCWLLGLEKRFT